MNNEFVEFLDKQIEIREDFLSYLWLTEEYERLKTQKDLLECVKKEYLKIKEN